MEIQEIKTPEVKYQCTWNPKPDITTFELAQCIPYIMCQLHDTDKWEALDESITRHFNVKIYQYGKVIRKSANALRKIMESFDKK